MIHIDTLIEQAIKDALKDAFDLTLETIEVEVPSEKKLGDFSTNTAMKLARTLRKNPFEIASTLKPFLEKNTELFKAVEVARPGFINFFVSEKLLEDTLKAIEEAGSDFGHGVVGEGTSVNIEFVSANPTGSLHVGHARGAAAGDNLARLMTKAGYTVTKEFYVNDGGNQINNLARSLIARYEQLLGKDTKIPEDGYHGSEITKIAKDLKEKYGDKFIHEDGFETFKQVGVDSLLEGLKKDLHTFGVDFDIFFSEASLYKAGKVEETLKYLNEKALTYREEDAVFLRTGDYGDDKDRVIVKSDGSYTYLMPDIAYHLDKLKRGYDVLIDVLGADHHGYVPRLKAAIEMMSGKKDVLDVEMLQLVKVLRDGEEIKMSKRSGKAITLSDLIDEVGVDAIRYFFARHSLNTHMDLDLDLALKKTNENPVYYAQYAHARIMTLLSKARERGFDTAANVKTFDHLSDPLTRGLILKVAEYPKVIKDSALARTPHKVTNYIHSLASTLHGFYGGVQVLSDNEKASLERIYILKLVAVVLKDALEIIGVSAPESM
ncbi:MAG: arginine--tRNA ligase [Bacillota bacterium]